MAMPFPARTAVPTLLTLLSVLGSVLLAGPASAGSAAMHATASTTSVGSPGTAARTRGLSPGVYEQRLQRWTNVQRRRHGVRPVRANRCADRYAEAWTRRLVRTGRFFHRDQGVVLRGCHATAAGEVIARGPVTPRRMVRMWMGSPGHRAILLSRRFRLVGIGARRAPDGAWVATQNYLRP
jgi:uncharacterized protein YkwD